MSCVIIEENYFMFLGILFAKNHKEPFKKMNTQKGFPSVIPCWQRKKDVQTNNYVMLYCFKTAVAAVHASPEFVTQHAIMMRIL